MIDFGVTFVEDDQEFFDDSPPKLEPTELNIFRNSEKSRMVDIFTQSSAAVQKHLEYHLAHMKQEYGDYLLDLYSDPVEEICARLELLLAEVAE